MTSKVKICAAAAFFAAFAAGASQSHRPVGAPNTESIYATDAFPGFDGLDDIPKPEKKKRSWFLSVSRETPEAQLAYAREEEEAGNLRAARRGYDALVREWPASPEAPKAQLALAELYEKKYCDSEEAFAEFDYLLDFYARECEYAEVVERQYRLANLMVEERGLFTSARQLRQNYEKVVRRAPGAPYVPEAMLAIAAIREGENEYEEAVLVYAEIAVRFPRSPAAEKAVYLNAKCRMWLVRRLAYNLPRCRDTALFLKRVGKEWPAHPCMEEMAGWLGELQRYMAEDAYERAKFYDTRRRSRHAAAAAYAKFLEEYPDSPRAEEVRARLKELSAGK